MKNARGFTLVEILVVVVIITVLATIGTLTYGGFQSQSRDSKREANANVIADSLERYYEKNGEYPSIADVTNTNAAQVKTLLNISDTSSLLMPDAPANITNSIKPPTESLNPGIIAYDAKVANSADNTSCQQQGGSCDSFTLRWQEEAGQTEVINSRNQDRVGVLQAPPNPILNTTIVSGKVVAKVTHSSSPVCTYGTAQYRIMSSTTDVTPTWSAPSESWQPVDSLTISSPTPSTEYFFYAKARCISSDGGEAENTTVAKDSFYYTTANMVASWNGTIAEGTITSGTVYPICQSGQTPRYFIQSKVDTISAAGTWSPSTATWATSNKAQITVSSNPTKVSFRGQVRCDDPAPAPVGTPYPQSNTDFVVSAPAKPQLTRTVNGMPSAQWSWPAVACPQTTTVQYKGSYGGNYPYYGYIDNVASPHTLPGVWNDGYTYEFGVRAVCGTPSTKVLMSDRDANALYLPVKADIAPGAGKFFTTDTVGNYTRAAVRIQSASSGTCNGLAQRWVIVRMRQNARGQDSNGGPVWYNGPWAGGDIRVESDRVLMARQVGYGGGADDSDRDVMESNIWVSCRNPTTGEMGPERYIDRYGILVIWGTNNSIPKPQKYRVDCTGQSFNGNYLDPAWLHCDPNGYTREGGEANAWAQF